MRVLVVNAGSSSLRLRVLDADDSIVDDAHFERWDDTTDEGLRGFVGRTRADAVGHRVVHGGAALREAAAVDDRVIALLEDAIPLAPLHQPRALACIHRLRELLPNTPAVACLDTAYHRTLAPAAATYAVPREWRERWNLVRYGFHGLSHAYAAREAARRIGRPRLRVVTCHLGAGSSLCASVDGRSVDTTMGFTPLEGLVMATRSGSVDPGLLLWLLQNTDLSISDVADGLTPRSGLRGISGESDMREVLARRAGGDEAATLAFDVYVHRLAGEIARMTAALGGLDVLVFTGGVGEHEPSVRDAAAERLAYLGVGTTVPVLVIEAREDIEIARQTREVIAAT